jgi:hypothetical protein
MPRQPMTSTNEGGQASVEFVAMLPLLVIVGAVLAQATVAGWAVWSAAGAARSAARALAVGQPPLAAARHAVPVRLRGAVSVEVDGDGVRVRVRVPALIDGMSPGSVGARASFPSQAGPPRS